MTGCSAKGCRNSTVKGFVMKRFPRDPARRSAWASNVKREGWEPTNASCLCEVHFDDSQWEDQDWGGTPKLKRTAVPTVFCNCSYGKKRVRSSGSAKPVNTTVMTEHSYGSVQGSDNSLTAMLSKGKVDRRYDHQYATLADEEVQSKSDVKKVKVEVRREGHDEFCPVYNSPKRRALVMKKSMDKNNNGNLDSGSMAELFSSKIEKEVEINHVQGELTVVHVNTRLDLQTPSQNAFGTPTKAQAALQEDHAIAFNTSTPVQSQGAFVTSLKDPLDIEPANIIRASEENLIATSNSPRQVQTTSLGELPTPCSAQVVQLVLLPDEHKIKEEPDIKLHYNIPEIEQPCAISRLEVDSDAHEDESLSSLRSNSPIDTKDHNTKSVRTVNSSESSSCNVLPTPKKSKECNCRKETLDMTKIRTAEKVLARQGRLVKRVAALQRQLTRQKHSHELEIEKLMKRFHELEEKFDLTRSILRSCIGDDQFTVYATQNARGVIWSKNTIEKAMQLRNSCGATGYNAVSKLLIPLPSDRTLRRYNQKTKPQDGVYVEIVKDTSD